MGLKSTGSNPVFPKMNSKTNSTLTSNINLAFSRRSINNKFRFTNNSYYVLKCLRSLGLINSLSLIFIKGIRYIRFSLFLYKSNSFFYKIKNVSTSTKRYYTSLKSLQLMNTYLKASTVLLSTPRGILTHREALKLRVGGVILFAVL